MNNVLKERCFIKVLYDHQIFTYQSYGGISRYFYELMTEFYLQQLIKFELSLVCSRNVYFKKSCFYSNNFFFKGNDSRPMSIISNLVNKKDSINKLKAKNFDVFHPTYYNPYFLKYIDDKPFVLTIHDMIHELYPEIFSKSDKDADYKKILSIKSTKIIVPSECTKRDLIRIYRINESKIHIIYHGCTLNSINKINIPKLQLPKKYFLFVGKRGTYKNFYYFINTIA